MGQHVEKAKIDGSQKAKINGIQNARNHVIALHTYATEADMSEKNLDAKNRWRNVVISFRMSPEEARELNTQVSLTGLSKQDYIIQCLLKREIRVVCGQNVARQMRMYLEAVLEELQFLDEHGKNEKGEVVNLEELLMPLGMILEMLGKEDGSHF